MAKIENLVDEGWGADKNLFVHFYLTVNNSFISSSSSSFIPYAVY